MFRALLLVCRDVLLWGFVAGVLVFLGVWLWLAS